MIDKVEVMEGRTEYLVSHFEKYHNTVLVDQNDNINEKTNICNFFDTPLKSDQEVKFQELLIKCTAECNFAFTWIEKSSIIDMLLFLRPSIKHQIPSRKKLSKLTSTYANKISLFNNSNISINSLIGVTLSVDSWTCISKTNLCGFVVSSPFQKPSTLKILKVDPEKLKGIDIAEDIIKVINIFKIE